MHDRRIVLVRWLGRPSLSMGAASRGRAGMSKVYLASPYGFAASTRAFLESLKSELSRTGHRVIDPFGRLQVDRPKESLLESNERISKLNEQDIVACDVVVAGLDGPDVDSGTASEIGFAYAMGKRIIGLRTDLRRTGENDAARVNMQVQHWIVASQGRIVNSVEELLSALKEPRAERGGNSLGAQGR